MIIKSSALMLKIYSVMAFLLIFVSSKAFSFPYKGLDLKIGGKIAERYNDNIEFNGDGKTSDFTTELSLNTGIQYLGKTRIMGFTGNIKRKIFSKNRNLNNTSGDFTLNFQNEVSKYDRMEFYNTFTLTFEPGSFEDEFGRTRVRSRSSDNTFNFIYRRDISEQIAIIARYSNKLRRVSGENTIESFRNNFGLTTNYVYSATTTFFLSYDFLKTEYKDTGISFPNHTAATGMRQYISKQLYFDVLAGADFIERTLENKKITSIEGYIKALLTDEFKNTNVKVTFEKRKKPNINREEIFDSWKTSVSLERRFSKRLRCSFSGFYGQGIYESSDITEKLLGANAGVTYAFSENINGGLSYIYSKKTSTDLTQIPEYTRNTIISVLTVGF